MKFIHFEKIVNSICVISLKWFQVSLYSPLNQVLKLAFKFEQPNRPVSAFLN